MRLRPVWRESEDCCERLHIDMNKPTETAAVTEDAKQGATEPLSARHWWNRTVIGAGVTSALGDFCYETTTVILPGFLAVLGIPAAGLGIIEGIADTVASFTKMLAGFIADKLGHRKLLVLVGYGLTPLGQMLIASAAGWPLLLTGRAVSWFGKGLRGPLRRRHCYSVDQSRNPWPSLRLSPRDGHHRCGPRAAARCGPVGLGKDSPGKTRRDPFAWYCG